MTYAVLRGVMPVLVCVNNDTAGFPYIRYCDDLCCIPWSSARPALQ